MESHKTAAIRPSTACRGRGPWHPLGYERIFLCRFSYDAASSRTSIHSAEMQLVPHADASAGKKKWRRKRVDMITLSAGGAKMLREYLQPHARAQAEAAHSLQPRSTRDIINYHFINFASGHRERHAVAQMMCWKWKWGASPR